MELWRVGDLIKKGIVTFVRKEAIVIVVCGTLAVEAIPVGHAKMPQPHPEHGIEFVASAEPPRCNFVLSGVASAVSLGDLGFRLSAVWPTNH
jgi:hypothetical protein